MHQAIDTALAAIGVTFSVIFVSISPDTATLAGACIAGIIALNDARKTEKDRLTLVCVLLASIAAGLLLPGAILWNWYPTLAERLTFHMWALSGIFAGLFGWALVLLAFALRDALLKRRQKIAEDALNRFKS